MSDKNLKNKQKNPPVQPVKPKKTNAILQDLTNFIKGINIKQLFLKNISFVIMGIVTWQISPRIPFIPFPNWVTGVLGALGLKLMVYVKGKNAKKYRKDIEYGSARWGVQ